MKKIRPFDTDKITVTLTSLSLDISKYILLYYSYARGQGSYLNASRVGSCPTREKVHTSLRATPRFTF